ncbi:hypothetical protein BP5796_11576 [Coleophoma crateriformis]|uniref:Uncharacterized protein n=1 Tax=Coleophoma crateriformis TaxID=565419 RepID=A0A3D8QJR7_9HELO|nr:hypothetical protein BP5796_11576 [Coleophoma crateriformis]
MDTVDDSKEIRSRHNLAIRTKAPLAANLEDGLQGSERLQASIQANKRDLKDEHILGDDCYSRFKSSGYDTNELSQSYIKEQAKHASEIDKSTCTSTEEIGVHDYQVPGVDLQQRLEDVADIINCLLDLLPSLRDPVAQGNYKTNESGEHTSKDIKIAMVLFPKAPLSLNERLGRANWKRRQNLKKAR